MKTTKCLVYILKLTTCILQLVTCNLSAGETPSTLQGSYRIYEEPVESPNHGERSLTADPDHPSASPQGWHDGTTTTGPNADVYWDRDNNGTPDGRPTGTNLSFDFPLNLGDGSPEDNRDAIATNTFYWVNRIHDLLYLKGFTPDYGNFQDDDPFLVSLQTNGSNSENTPATLTVAADGSSPRLTLHEWSYRFPNIVVLDDQDDTVFNGFASHATFGDPLTETGISGEIIYVEDAIGDLHEACGPDFNNDLTGKIALIDRGGCGYVDKAENVQNAGAIAVIVTNLPGEVEPELMEAGSPIVTIPSVMIGYYEGLALKETMNNETVTATLREAIYPNRDPGLDGSIIAYHYGIAMALRLVGLDCLDHLESPRLGWGAFLAMALTDADGSGPRGSRGYGSYMLYNHSENQGAAASLYGQVPADDQLTYGEMGFFTSEEQIGSVWAAALWDLYQIMIDAYSYNANLEEADGGNNITLRLVLEAMRHTPCQASFVAARNALLNADELIYGGVNGCYIWQAFSGRGLGSGAATLDPSRLNDNLASTVEPAFADSCGNPFYGKHLLAQWGLAPVGCICNSGTSSRIDVSEFIASVSKTPYVQVDRSNVDENIDLDHLIGTLSILPDSFRQQGTPQFELLSQSHSGAIALVGTELRVANPDLFNHEANPSMVVHLGSVISEYLRIGADITIVVNDLNENPRIDTLIPNQNPLEDQAYNLDLTLYFIDPDTDSLSYSATGLPSSLSLSASGLITGTPSNDDAHSGSFEVVVTGTDSETLFVTASFLLTVVNVNDRPLLVSAIGDKTVPEDAFIRFDIANRFSDPDGDSLSFSAVGLPNNITLSQAGEFSGTPDNDDYLNSPFTVTVRASDPGGLFVEDSHLLTVLNSNDTPLVTTLIPNSNAAEDAAFFLDLTSNFSDPDGDALIFTAVGLPASLSLSTAGVITGTPTNAEALNPGYVVVVTVNDPSSAHVSDTFLLTVVNVNDAPQLELAIGNQTAIESLAFSLDVSANFSDPEADALSFSATGLPPRLVISAAGVISGTPNDEDRANSPFAVTVTATDPSNASVADSFTLTVSDFGSPPQVDTPIADVVATEDAPFSLDISGNFSDPDPDDSLTFTSLGLPASLMLSTVGMITGTPVNADFLAGPFSVTIRASDPNGASVNDVFVLTVANTNDAPLLATSIPDTSATEDVPFSLAVDAQFSDPDGDNLSFTATGLPASLTITPAGEITGTPVNDDFLNSAFAIIVTASDPSNATVADSFQLTVLNTNDTPLLDLPLADSNVTQGTPFSLDAAPNFSDPDGDSLVFTATGLPDSMSISAVGMITGTASNDDFLNGPFTVIVMATDPSSANVSDSFTLGVININDAPVLVAPLFNRNATEDLAFDLAVAASFSDPDGDTLSFTATGLPPTLSISAAGVFTGTPVNDDFLDGPFTVTVTASDGSLSVADSFMLTVLNTNDRPMILVPIDHTIASEGTPFSYDIAAFFGDPDGDSLTFSATGLPPSLVISASGVIAGTPNNDDVLNGPFVVTVRASDPSFANVADTFQLTVSNINSPPLVVAPILDSTTTENEAFSMDVADHFDDPDGDILSFSATGLPNTLSISTAGVISGTPTAWETVNVEVTASDPGGLRIADTFSLKINAIPLRVTPIPDQTANLGTFFSLDVSDHFNDPDGDSLTFTAPTLPQASGLAMSNAGIISGTPVFIRQPPFNLTFTVVASDPYGESASDAFTIVVNDALFTFHTPSEEE